jgi:hypothetical protein
MRYIKKHYFLKPPLTDADFVLLMLNPPDEEKSPVPEPVDHPGIEVIKWAPHALGFRYFVAIDMGGGKSNYGVRVFFGLVEPGAKVITGKPSSTRLADNVHILSEPPQSAADLPDSFFTRRKKDIIELPPEASGKICYLSLRFETSPGKVGPWGTMISTVVP